MFVVLQKSDWTTNEIMVGIFFMEEDAKWFVEQALEGSKARIKEVDAWEPWFNIKREALA